LSRVTVVTPTYNERENITQLYARLRAVAPDVDILVIDDGSPDGTAELVDELAGWDDRISVHRRDGKQGLASAYVLGFELALERGADRIIQMDADLSHAPEDVPRLLAVDADVVIGSRYVQGGGTVNWPIQRRLLSRCGSLYARWCLGLPFRDLTGGFKVWRRHMLTSVLSRPVESDGYAFQVELTWRAWRAGGRMHEVPIIFTERTAGVSKIDRGIAVEAAWLVPALRLRR